MVSFNVKKSCSRYFKAPHLIMAYEHPGREIRALYDDETITVYQAYSEPIASAAINSQRLTASPDFKPDRMTWIKPSYAWMMYRSGYSYKDARQARILALKMKREHFVALLGRGVLTSHAVGQSGRGEERKRTTDVKIQWDPERSPRLHILPYRSIQVGIPADLSTTWADEWIVSVRDVTDESRRLKQVLDHRRDATNEQLIAMDLFPRERPFHLTEALMISLGMTQTTYPGHHDSAS